MEQCPFARRSALPRSPIRNSPRAADEGKQQQQQSMAESRAEKMDAGAETNSAPSTSTIPPPFPTAASMASTTTSSSSSSSIPALKARSIPSIGHYSFDPNSSNPFGTRVRRGEDQPLPKSNIPNMEEQQNGEEQPQTDASATQDQTGSNESEQASQSSAMVIEISAPAPQWKGGRKLRLLGSKRAAASSAATSAPASTEHDHDDGSSSQPAAGQPADNEHRSSTPPPERAMLVGKGERDRPICAAGDRPLSGTAAAAAGGERPIGGMSMSAADLDALLDNPNPFGARGASKMARGNTERAIRPATASAMSSGSGMDASSSSASGYSAIAVPAEPTITTTPARSAAGDDAAAATAGGSEPDFVRPNTPLVTRLVDKNWRVRADAYGEIVSTLDSDSTNAPTLTASFTPYIAKMCADSNVNALEKALVAVSSIIRHHVDGLSLVEEVMPPLMKKGLPGRSSTLQLAIDVIHTFIYIGGSVGALPVLSYLVTGATETKSTLIKVQCASAHALKACLAAYGPKVVRVSEIINVWPTLLAATNPAVRKEAMELGAEIYRWLGPVFTQQLGTMNIKEAQQRELDALFAATPFGSAKPERYTRAEEAKMKKTGKTAEPFDPLSLVAAVDVCSKLPEGWCDLVTSGAKAAERKAAISELATLAESAPKIQVTAATTDVSLALARVLKDANLIVVGEALKCVRALAKGARAEFSTCARTLCPPLFSLLKEKKTLVRQNVHACLDLFFVHCLDLDAMLEWVLEETSAAMPKQRSEVMLVAGQWFQHPEAKGKVSVNAAKTLAETASKLLGDSDRDVREQSLTTLAALVGVVGRKAVSSILSKIELTDSKKMTKLESIIRQTSSPSPDAESNAAANTELTSTTTPSASVAVSVSAPTKSSTLRPSTASASASRSNLATKKSTAGTLPARPSSAAPGSKIGKNMTLKKGALDGKSAGVSSGSSTSSTAAAPSTPEASAPVLSYEDSLTQLSAHPAIGDGIINFITSKKWNETVDGLQQLQTALTNMSNDECSTIMPAVFYFLAKTPSFKPSNVQVSKNLYEILPNMTALLTPFPLSLLTMTIPDLFNKLSDKKFSDGVALVILAYAEASTPSRILTSLLSTMDRDGKNVKSGEASIGVVVKMIQEFGAGAFDVNAIIETAKQWTSHVHPGIRDAALPVFIAIYSQSGSMLKELMLSGLKPTTASTLESEFSKLGSVDPSSFVPQRRARAAPQAAKLDLDDVLPRVDISSQMSEELLAKLTNDNSKVRKEGLEDVMGIIAAAHHRIGPKDGGLIEVLKLRLADNNKVQAKEALNVLSALINAMGSPITRHASKLLPPLLAALADSKSFVREAARSVFLQWFSLSGVQSTLKYLPKAMEQNATGRLEILEALATRLQLGPNRALDGVNRFDLSELITPVLNACLDKSADVRAANEKVMEHVVANVGFDRVMEETKGMKKASILAITPTIEKFRYAKETAAAREQSSSSSSSASNLTVPIDSHDDVRPQTAPANSTKRLAARKSVMSAANTPRGETSSASSGGASSAGASATSSISDEKKASVMRARSRQSTIPLKRPATAAPASSTPSVASVSESGADAAAGTDSTTADASSAPSSSSSSALLKKFDHNAKRNRVLKDSKRVRGVYRDMSADEIEELDQQLYTVISDELYAAMQSKEFQKHLLALDLIDRELSTNADAVLSISDLIFKWCSWRMTDANTSLLAKMLPTLHNMLTTFDTKSGYKLTDGEAANILPTLIEKALGHNTTRFRTDCRELLVQFASLYPPSKLFVYLIHGFDSKNKRVQSECVEHVGSMLARYGVGLCDARKMMPSIAAMVASADANVRNAALNALQSVYTAAGEELWTMLGKGTTAGKDKIPAKCMSMIEERMKKVKSNTQTQQTMQQQQQQQQQQMISSEESAAAPPTNAASVPSSSTSTTPSTLSVPSTSPFSSPLPSPSNLTPRKGSMLPLPRGKKSLLSPPSASKIGMRSQTMRPADFAAAARRQQQDMELAQAQTQAQTQMHNASPLPSPSQSPSRVSPESLYQSQAAALAELESEYEQTKAIVTGNTNTTSHEQGQLNQFAPTRALQRTPLKASARHARHQSNVVDYSYHAQDIQSAIVEEAETESRETAPMSNNNNNGNLPGCFSLDFEPIPSAAVASSPPRMSPSPLSPVAASPRPVSALSSPSQLSVSTVSASAGGVAHSSFLSDTLIVLSEPSVPAEERIDALEHMSRIMAAQGAASIRDNEEGIVEVLIAEMSSSLTIHEATGMVSIHTGWNRACLGTIHQLVSHRSLVAALPQQVLDQLLAYLFQQLSDARILRSPNCTELVNSCNQSILAALEAMTRTRAFTTTIDMLRTAVIDELKRPTTDLIAKCVSKLHKVLMREGVDGVDVASIIRSIHSFTVEVAQIDELASAATAIRTVNAVLHEIVAMMGSSILSCLDLPRSSPLWQTISQLLQANNSNNSSNNTSPAQQQQQQQWQQQQHSQSDYTESSYNDPHASTAYEEPTYAEQGEPHMNGVPSDEYVSNEQPASATGEAGPPISYRQRLAALQSRASMATAPTHAHRTNDATSSIPQPAALSVLSNNANAAASRTPSSSLDSIRARFRKAQEGQENKNELINTHDGSDAMYMDAHMYQHAPSNLKQVNLLNSHDGVTQRLSNNSNTTVTAAPASNLLALRQKVATLNANKKA